MARKVLDTSRPFEIIRRESLNDLMLPVANIATLAARTRGRGLVPVTTRNVFPDITLNGTTGGRTVRIRHTVCYPFSAVTGMVTNQYVASTGDTFPTGASSAYTLGFEHPDDSTLIANCYLAGVRDFTIITGGSAIPEPVGLDGDPGEYLWSRLFNSTDSGVQGVANFFNRAMSAWGEGVNTNTNLAIPGSGAVTANRFGGQAPSLILGITNHRNPVSVAYISDSIMRGQNDYGSGHYLRGFMNIALKDAIPSFNLCRGSELARDWKQLKCQMRLAHAAHCTHAVVGYGRNDLAAGRTDAELRADTIAIGDRLARLGIIPLLCTILPNPTSTTFFKDYTNQTRPSWETARKTHNDWRRSVPAPFAGCFDICVGVEVNQQGVHVVNGEFWPVLYTSDYDTGTATAGAASSLTDSGKSWTTDQHVGRVLIITAGTGSGQGKVISANTGTVLDITPATWTTNPSTDSVYAIIDAATDDGTHMSPAGHVLAAQGVNIEAFTL